jgi:hypothetical protein
MKHDKWSDKAFVNSQESEDEGLNPPIHCALSRGIANPIEKPLDKEGDGEVEL